MFQGWRAFTSNYYDMCEGNSTKLSIKSIPSILPNKPRKASISHLVITNSILHPQALCQNPSSPRKYLVEVSLTLSAPKCAKLPSDPRPACNSLLVRARSRSSRNQRTLQRAQQGLILRSHQIRHTIPFGHCTPRNWPDAMQSAFQKPIRHHRRAVADVHNRVSRSRRNVSPVGFVLRAGFLLHTCGQDLETGNGGENKRQAAKIGVRCLGQTIRAGVCVIL